ncbi:MAG TPA: glucose-6-phosphate dehydrogenase, partial [Xanthobacteraceae bacterium]|nr:glucose-6-phosphate dehydrogenase [Xanthobacteraceae bacterium]
MMTRRSASTAVPADPCCFVVFGASGDLAHRLLVPALYNLAMRGLLPEAFAIIGVARAERSEEAFRAELQNGLRHFVIGKVD